MTLPMFLLFDKVGQCRVRFARILARHGVTEPVNYPDFSTKKKAQVLAKAFAEGKGPNLLSKTLNLCCVDRKYVPGSLGIGLFGPVRILPPVPLEVIYNYSIGFTPFQCLG